MLELLHRFFRHDSFAEGFVQCLRESVWLARLIVCERLLCL
jgi:hypothetical protein